MPEPRYPDGFFARQDEAADREFYASPRFVTHIDDANAPTLRVTSIAVRHAI